MPKYKPGDLVIVHGPTCEIAGFTFGAPIPWNDDMDRYKGRTLRVCRVTGYGTIRLAPADDTLIRDLGYDRREKYFSEPKRYSSLFLPLPRYENSQYSW
jgi:hypothetical protein